MFGGQTHTKDKKVYKNYKILGGDKNKIVARALYPP